MILKKQITKHTVRTLIRKKSSNYEYCPGRDVFKLCEGFAGKFKSAGIKYRYHPL